MNLFDNLTGGLWAVCAFLLVWILGRAGAEITYVTLADGRRAERRLPLLFRLLLPFAPNLAGLTRHERFAALRARTQTRLVSAGFESLLDAAEFLALRTLILLVGAPLFLLILRLSAAALPAGIGATVVRRLPLLGLLVLLVAFLRPELWLRDRLRQRHREIERSLPFALDLLTLSVEAGLDFMASIKRLVDRTRVDALNEELIRMFREVQVGKTRKEALRDTADRVNQPDLRTVLNALVQADELGVSIGAILRIQSDQMRVRRFLSAEKTANEAPVRMLFPLVLFIFPSVMIVLFGPMLIQILRHGL
jgi:tight adherence protein C